MTEKARTIRCLMIFVVAMAVVDVAAGYLIATDYDTEIWASVGTVITMTGIWLGIEKFGMSD